MGRTTMEPTTAKGTSLGWGKKVRETRIFVGKGYEEMDESFIEVKTYCNLEICSLLISDRVL